ncbi:MAG: hypothetical protein Q9218_004235 [Villophora microphyllina]
MTQIQTGVVEYIINHVFLPPQLPQSAEGVDVVANAEQAMLAAAIASVDEYKQHVAPKFELSWHGIQKMLLSWVDLKPWKNLSEELLYKSIMAMAPEDILPVRVSTQNAALVFRRCKKTMNMECFEMSPRSKDVMSCGGRLRRHFPSYGISLPLEVMADPAFCEQLVTMLKRMDSEVVPEILPSSNNKDSSETDDGDTCHPRLVTELLMATLAATGKPTRMAQVQKRIRDDVFQEGGSSPWRRSTLWLILRVCLQTTLARSLEPADSAAQYKNFMISHLSDLLGLAAGSRAADGLCKVMQMKIARRAFKLGQAILPFVRDRALVQVQMVSLSLDEIWRTIRTRDADRRTTIDLATIENDTILTLENSRRALDVALHSSEHDSQPAISTPVMHDNWLDFDSDGLPVVSVDDQSTEDKIYALTRFEQWIWLDMPSWLETTLQKPHAKNCSALARSAEIYRDLAMEVYDGCPEQMSLMLLTVGDMWYALDRIAGAIIPLLFRYSPGIADNVFYPLLLPQKSQMQRLKSLEGHIKERYQKARFKSSSIITDPGPSDTDCFSSRYFETSDEHRELFQRIVAEANERRDEKKREWEQKREQFEMLTKERDSIACNDCIYQGVEMHKPSRCGKCRLDREIKGLRIGVHEWPLPNDEVQARLVVLHLRCPTVLAAWRDLTWILVHDLGRPGDIKGTNPAILLNSYPGLADYYEEKNARFLLASTTRSITTTRQSKLTFPIDLDQLYVENPLHFKMYDGKRNTWVCNQDEEPSFFTKSQTQLPEGPYKRLQYAIDSTKHTQNEVLASQTDCSIEMNLHEFVAYGSLRADGERTQWFNICRELRATNLTWNSEPVCNLIKQTAWQVGSPGSTYLRTTHSVFGIPEFSIELLSNISKMFSSIKGNRQTHHTMEILIILLLRALSLSVDELAATGALGLLRDCRVATFSWAQELDNCLRIATTMEQVVMVRQSLLRVAALCKLTFDMDGDPSSELVSPRDVQAWATCSMIVQDNTPSAQSTLPTELRQLLLHDTKISIRLYRPMQRLLMASALTGLDYAISRSWSAFESSVDTWQYPEHNKGRWVCKKSSSSPQGESQTVAYNILSGELLVDGRPLGLLPKEYTTNKEYIRIFGAQKLRVSASDMIGMPYMTVNNENGYTFYFGMRATALVIKAKDNSTIFELIPHTAFTNDVPNFFIEDYVHWFDLNTHIVDFRPLRQRWTTDVLNWRLVYRPGGQSSLHQGDARMIDIRSQTCLNTSDVFGGLEKTTFMDITTSGQSKLQIALPRLGLRFFLNADNDLECQELRMVIDSDQCLDTLIGLQSRLVLCAPGRHSRKLDRLVIIPKGDVLVSREEPHLAVRIAADGRDVQCLRYQYNPVLNRLDSDGSMTSRLYQAYLHAVTSYILPDPLTGSLGTEQSLRILEEQIVRVYKPLEAADVELLELIRSLTPHRSFHQKGLQVVQRVLWHTSVDALCQHGNFATCTDKIFSQGQSFHMFYQGLDPCRTLRSRGDEALLERAKLRNVAYSTVDHRDTGNAPLQDKDYQARDMESFSERACRSFEISSYVLQWSSDMAIMSRLADRWREWGTVTGFGNVDSLPSPFSDLLKLDLAPAWGSLYELCRSATRQKSRYNFLFLFSRIAYGSRITTIEDLKVLLGFATNPSLQKLPQFPRYRYFNLQLGNATDKRKLASIVEARKQPFSASRSNLSASERGREMNGFEQATSTKVSAAVKFYQKQAPCQQPKHVPQSYNAWLRLDEIKEAIDNMFQEWHKNNACVDHISLIQQVLDATLISTAVFPYEHSSWHQVMLIPRPVTNRALPAVTSLMGAAPRTFPTLPPVFYHPMHAEGITNNMELRSLINSFGVGNTNRRQSRLRRQYKADLQASLNALHGHLEPTFPDHIDPATAEKTFANLRTCDEHYMSQSAILCHQLQPATTIDQLLDNAGLWPRLKLCDLLQSLASTALPHASKEWKEALACIGLCVTLLQRARRLVLSAERHDTATFFKEFDNPGHQHWNAVERPEWLLLEIDNDFLIRKLQVSVALEMIHPSGNCNALMQLNMGEGKSSVIIPMIVSALADGKQLVRVVVLRSLTRQMHDTLVQRLGGLLRRPIYFMPFSRQTEFDETVLQNMQGLYKRCMTDRGVLIAQPEHALSLKLMGVAELAANNPEIATRIFETQRWLDTHCRDVLDESDEILDVRYQLVYTLGAQRDIEGQPDRWLMMQSIFDIVQAQASLLQASNPGRVEVEKQSSASFPTIRLLTPGVRHLLIDAVAEEIMSGKIAGFNTSNLPDETRQAIDSFINNSDVTEEECDVVQQACNGDEGFLKTLFFVRGLIAGGILLHVLHGKRWSVTYGLNPSRCLYAVPYRAKGVPAATAEFGHPDVAIALSCLSYYYTGLNNAQLRTSLEMLQKADDPSVEYTTWVMADPSFPCSLKHWSSVNLEDQQQCDIILFPALKFNKKVADFFLAHVVFPKEGKEFDRKLSVSGWDIPARPELPKVTTGFSGTNDNRFLLPSLISQHDLPQLQHTSGKVLELIARPENLRYCCAKDSGGMQLTSNGLLKFIIQQDPAVRVLVDVGAHILDLTNHQVIAQWLAIHPDADAGCYFDVDDYPVILTKSGKVEKLATSSFLNRLDRCLVYMDEVHTRACMRLRQLGQGQSLMFVAPPEVHQDIVKTTMTDGSSSLHALEWALQQSSLQIERSQPLRALQGLAYHHRYEAMQELNTCLAKGDAGEDAVALETLTEKIVEHETQGLRELYAPECMCPAELAVVKQSRLKSDKEVQSLLKEWDSYNSQASRAANINEEFEREVGHEVEQEKQIERPPKALSEYPSLDANVKKFIRAGNATAISCFASANDGILQHVSAARCLSGRTSAWSHIRTTDDFAKTVQRSKAGVMDHYVRPVHWVLVPDDPSVQCVLLISQFEVNQCFDAIQGKSSKVKLVSYEPRVTKSMLSIDSSVSHPLPQAKEAWDSLTPIVRQELHLFAGQLYFTHIEEYELMKSTLASQTNAVPLNFVKEWIGIRRKGQNYLRSHIGQVLSGSLLLEEAFETVDQEESLFL